MKSYEKKFRGELIEICKARHLSSTGTKEDLIARLLENDKEHEGVIERTLEVADIPDPSLLAGRFLLYDSSIPRSRDTVRRIIAVLRRRKSPFSLIDINHEAYMNIFWHKESKGRTLPALVKQGRVIGDLGQIRRWFESDDLNKSIDEACQQAGVGVEDPPGLFTAHQWFYKPMIVPEEGRHLKMLQPLVPFQRFSLPKRPPQDLLDDVPFEPPGNVFNDECSANSESNDS